MFVTSSLQTRFPVSRTTVSRPQGSMAGGLLTSGVMFSGAPDGSKKEKDKQAATAIQKEEDTLDIKTRAKTPELGGEASSASTSKEEDTLEITANRVKTPEPDSEASDEEGDWDKDFRDSDSGEEIVRLTEEEKQQMEKEHRDRKLKRYGEQFEAAGRVLGYVENRTKEATRYVGGAVKRMLDAVQDTTLSLTEQALKVASTSLHEAHRQVQNYKNSPK